MLSDGRCRVAIERLAPSVDGGRFAVKRVVGDRVVVEADVFADGHDELRAEVLYRPADSDDWRRADMEKQVNDRWRGEFRVDRLGEHLFTVRGWVDPLRTWLRDLRKRLAAGQDVAVDLQIGRRWLDSAAATATDADRAALAQWSARLEQDSASASNLLADADELLALWDRVAPPRHATTYEPVQRLTVDPKRAEFSAWYELFPRSAAGEPGRQGTLRDVIARLPYVAEMGFDVLYLPPIHPIGRRHRKGKNNAERAEAGDVGSPWAIGAAEGGHKAILTELGSMDDFRQLQRLAESLGVQVALDIAFQCSPDHPYVAEHPSWFRHRPDGTIQYAENPPKKYQDIYPFDFETDDWQALWQELKSVFEYWIDHGVRIFRVDNPHTKPFDFWEWCLGDLKRRYPELIFLSEAFTRPKLKYRLAKLGFTQSYTYFAWRNTKTELTEYLETLTQSDVADFLRPNLWPNTPDILTEALQVGGRARFMSRLVLAATLGASYGIYGPPYEHGWSEPREPGSEEYRNSEKYQVHYHDIERPDSLRPLIAQVNRIRRENAALHRNSSLRFHPVDNEQLICYSKQDRDQANVIVTVVNLDPHFTHSGFLELPLDDFGIPPQQSYQMHDLLADTRFLWHGPRNYVQLDPRTMPAHIFRLRKHVRTEHDFEYYL